MYVTMADIKQFGHTDGCPKCDRMLRYGPSRAQGTAHSDACRERIRKELAKTEERRQRLESIRENQDQALAEHVEAREQQQAVGEELHESAEVAADMKFEKLEEETERSEFVAPPLPPSGGTGAAASTTAADYGEFAQGGEDEQVQMHAQEEEWAVPGTESDRPSGNISGPQGDIETDDEWGGDNMDMNIITAALGDAISTRIKQVDKEINALVESFGGHRGKYGRERKAAMNRMIAEIYSPLGLRRQRSYCLT